MYNWLRSVVAKIFGLYPEPPRAQARIKFGLHEAMEVLNDLEGGGVLPSVEVCLPIRATARVLGAQDVLLSEATAEIAVLQESSDKSAARANNMQEEILRLREHANFQAREALALQKLVQLFGSKQ